MMAKRDCYEILSNPEKRKLYDRFGYAAFDGSMGDDPEKYADKVPFKNTGSFSGSFGNGSGFRSFHFGSDGMDDILKQMFSGDFGEGSGFGSRGFKESAPADCSSEINISFREAALGGEKIIRFDDGDIGTLKVRIPAGINEGQSIRLAGKGAAGRGGKKGDLLLKVHVMKDIAYSREMNLRK